MGLFDKFKKPKTEEQLDEDKWRNEIKIEAKVEARGEAKVLLKERMKEEEKERLLNNTSKGAALLGKLAKGFESGSGSGDNKFAKALGGKTLGEMASDEKLDRMLGKSSGTRNLGSDSGFKGFNSSFSNESGTVNRLTDMKKMNMLSLGKKHDDVEILEPVSGSQKKPDLKYRKVNVPSEKTDFSEKLKKMI